MEPHPVDIHVGKKLRARRTVLGMSQEAIGEAVGITFQQVQKYERGLNRIGSSRLYEFSCLLGVNVSHFFEGLQKSLSEVATEESVSEHLNNKEILTLVRAYSGIKAPSLQKKMLSLLKTMAEEGK